jgi:acyl carrier protein
VVWPVIQLTEKEVNCMPEDVNVEETVRRIVCERLDKKPDQVTLSARFIDDLGADSLDLTELLMALEEEFSIDIDDEANQIETVADAVKYIKSKL